MTAGEKRKRDPLSWRDDASSSFSDWTIVITISNDKTHPHIFHRVLDRIKQRKSDYLSTLFQTKEQDDEQQDSASTTTYRVHKAILAVGPRSSDYFSTLFHMKTREQEDSTSRITLSEEEANSFPVMLDFMYSADGKCGITAFNAFHVKSLARYFQCHGLAEKVNDFVQNDLTPNNATSYLLRAYAEHNDEAITQCARAFIVKNHCALLSNALDDLPVELFESIVCSRDLSFAHHSCMSKRIYSYFQANPDVLGIRILHRLTTAPLRNFTPESANLIWTLMVRLDPEDEEEVSLYEFIHLSSACAKAIAPHWRALDLNPVKYDESPPHHLAACLTIFLGRAQHEAQISNDAKEALQDAFGEATSELFELRARNEYLERSYLHTSFLPPQGFGYVAQQGHPPANGAFQGYTNAISGVTQRPPAVNGVPQGPPRAPQAGFAPARGVQRSEV